MPDPDSTKSIPTDALGHDPLQDVERDSIWSFGQTEVTDRSPEKPLPLRQPQGTPPSVGQGDPRSAAKPAPKPSPTTPSAQTFHLVTFTIGVELFGINIKAIQEIIRHQEITPIPNVPPHVEGLINLRGRIMPVVNCRNRMGLPDDAATGKGAVRASADRGQGWPHDEARDQTTNHSRRIIIVNTGGSLIGLMVDAVREVMYVPSRVVESPSSVTTVGRSDYLIGVAKLENKRLLVILDLDKLLAQVHQSVNTH